MVLGNNIGHRSVVLLIIIDTLIKTYLMIYIYSPEYWGQWCLGHHQDIVCIYRYVYMCVCLLTSVFQIDILKICFFQVYSNVTSFILIMCHTQV